MGKKWLWLLASTFALSGWASYRYDGEFQRPHFTGSADCQSVFEPSRYGTTLYFLPQRRVAIHFKNADSVGFFQALNLYGLDGGFGDVGGSNEWQDGTGKWVVTADGIFSYEVLFLNVRVEKYLPGEKKPTCEAVAEYSGSSRPSRLFFNE